MDWKRTGPQGGARVRLHSQEFVYSHAYAKSLSTVAADGTQTHIERGLDSDGNVVETQKQVFFYSADMERNEQYTKENGQWVGIDK